MLSLVAAALLPAAAAAGSCPGIARWHDPAAVAAPRWATLPDDTVRINDDGDRVFDASLTSPPFVPPREGLKLRWQQRLQASWANSAGVLEVQFDDSPWRDFTAAGGRFLSGGYDSRAFAGNPLGDRPAWGGDRSTAEIRAELLPGAAVTTLRLRFRFGSSGTGDARPGWQIGGFSCAAG